MMVRVTAIGVISAAMMAGCTPTSETGPNGGLLDASTASQLFNRVCGQTAPTFDDFFAEVTRGSYRRDAQTDLYNHVRYDLSFGLTEGPTSEICRMEFRSNENPVNLALFLSGTLPATGQMNLDQDSGYATRELAPSVIFTFQPALEGENQHFAWIEAGVR